MKGRSSDRWVPVVSSVLVHAVILAAVGWSWWHFSSPPPAPAATNLAIEATLVTAPAVAPPAPPAVPAALPESEPVPPTPAAEDESKKQQEMEAQQVVEREAAEKREAQEQQAKAEESERKETERRQAEKQAAQKQKQDEAAREQKQREVKAAADARAAADAKARAAADARAKAVADAKAAADAQARQRQESELRAQLAAEERTNAARSGAQGAQYAAAIRARVERAWIRPPGVRPGLSCEVHVTQVPGGVVTAVSLGTCNGDEAVKQSIVDAVYRASPLPSPENADLFERNLVFNFKPNE